MGVSGSMGNKKIKVVELFAGVGGFRLGLEKHNYEVIWSNQWEPATKTQHASMVYEARFGKENHTNEDINAIVSRNVEEIPSHDLLVGGFPCQDYSVATTLNNAKGLKGKKGVLWWAIYQILVQKKQRPKYLLLENVDRLLKSPARQRGRDFAIMLQCLNDLGYAVEWRIINAAEYGMPQRRKRVFFIGYHKSTAIYKRIKKKPQHNWLTKTGVIAKAFSVLPSTEKEQAFELNQDLVAITNNFNKGGKSSPFQNTGMLIDGRVYTAKTEVSYKGRHVYLADVLQKEAIPNDFFIKDSELKAPKTVQLSDGSVKVITTEREMWAYLKGSTKEKRITKDGFEYFYNAGAVGFPDDLAKPARTIITGEGGTSPSRFKHVIKTEKGLRRLTPLELERLNMFPDNHTKLDNVTDAKRAFFMGNALVVGIVERLGEELYNQILFGW